MNSRKFITSTLIVLFITIAAVSNAQENSLINTSQSPFSVLRTVNMEDVMWTKGFWADWFAVCRESMIPHMMDMYMNDSISHGFANFEIAAGLKDGEHVGPAFHDGDFYKLLEAFIVMASYTNDAEMMCEVNRITGIIAKTQRADGYIHTPVVIAQLRNKRDKHENREYARAEDKQRLDYAGQERFARREFAERLDFETYNMGHLMTAACIHYRLTGQKNLLDIAGKATDFLYDYYKRNPDELAQNAICPSHYMGVIEMYRTSGDSRYFELAKGLIDIRDMVKNGTDHNQDRIPFRRQTKALGHAVRANYLYAGAADVFSETGDEDLMKALQTIWNDVTERKLYITGACGALYDGVSPNGTTYDQPSIQQVHQAYGQDYELPNLTAHNESCANIGNLLWNARMLLATGEAKYADVMEQVMYNSLLAGVSLDGKRHFYTNPLAVSKHLPYDLRWSKDREEYITYCNCCPPNTIRTIAQIHNYMYSLSDNGLRVNFYGGSRLCTGLNGNDRLDIEQVTDYPWNGNVKFVVHKMPKSEYSLYFRDPVWCMGTLVKVNGTVVSAEIDPSGYIVINRAWTEGDIVELEFPMEVRLMEANPLVEATRGQVAVQRGPVVYCLESAGLPQDIELSRIAIPARARFEPVIMNISGSELIGLKGDLVLTGNQIWGNGLYRPVSDNYHSGIAVTLIPYYAWNNRGAGDMSVWMPLTR